jgi:hypothetical protein
VRNARAIILVVRPPGDGAAVVNVLVVAEATRAIGTESRGWRWWQTRQGEIVAT